MTNKIPEVSCGKHTCKYYAKCRPNNFGIKECFCPDGCSFQALSPVCGRDSLTGQSKTFRSPCFLFYNSCTLQREITMTRLGRCREYWLIFHLPLTPLSFSLTSIPKGYQRVSFIFAKHICISILIWFGIKTLLNLCT